MKNKRNSVIIVGAFHEIIELAEMNNLIIIGLVDNNKEGSYYGYNIIGNDKNLGTKYNKYPIVITPDKPDLRQKLHQIYENRGFDFYTLISKKATISKTSSIGEGSIVQSGVNVSSECKIGKFVKLNTHSNIMHNTIIGNFTTIAPSAVLLGNVKIGKNCYIGSNCTILPNIIIGDNAIVGAGAVVTKNVVESETVIGVPAKSKKYDSN
jgi:UDP-N-acetylbacillosamine N-acetyltransferase